MVIIPGEEWEVCKMCTDSTVDWVSLYQKLAIEKYTVCGKVISSKKLVRNLKKIFLHKWHADLHGFANFCKLPVAHTSKMVQSKYFFLRSGHFRIPHPQISLKQY